MRRAQRWREQQQRQGPEQTCSPLQDPAQAPVEQQQLPAPQPKAVTELPSSPAVSARELLQKRAAGSFSLFAASPSAMFVPRKSARHRGPGDGPRIRSLERNVNPDNIRFEFGLELGGGR